MLAASCTSDQLDSNGACTLSGNGEKTPIAVKTNLSTAPTSRAFDKTFENGDKLFAYIEAGKMESTTFTPVAEFTWADNFTLGETIDNGGAAGVGNITTTDNLSPTLYWDDFSSTDYDLRESGRGIRLKYGYCFNGGEGSDNAKGATVQGNIITALNLETGVLGWKVLSDQSATGGVDMKKSDLLYAKTQAMITYGHDPEHRGTLTLPYTHAMSKVTINVTTGEGYSTDKANFASSVLTLKNMQVKSTVNAPAATVTASSDAEAIKDITTFNKSKANTTATYQAIIGPTTLTSGNILAAITNIDGNNYNIPLTDGILTAWSAEDKLVKVEEVIDHGIAQSKSRAGIDHGKSYITKPGIHYILNVTVDKQKITIRATITDWDNVTAEGKAAINFAGDVTEKGSIADELKANGFDVYKSSTNDAFTTKSTTVTYTSGEWKYAPVIYWAGQGDDSYFRAISPAGNSTSTLAQGTDLMWGTSAAEDKSGTGEETAIKPRTGDVALNFEHLMSRLSVKLETSSDAAAVNLTGATIKITNLATTGTYSIVDATVSAGSPAETMLEGKPSDFTEYVVPQTIGNKARLIITLADGTTYSLQLNKCVLTGTETVVGEWTKGMSYTYTIHLEKETATFRALVKEWDEATGSGNANLEWD